MTFEQCRLILSEIRRRQGTEHPLLQVSCSGAIVRGRLTRTDTDRLSLSCQHSPYGLLVLENPGLLAGPLTFVQIANIPDDGLKEFLLHEETKANEQVLVGAGRRS
jgi:hypothetical protein